MKYQLAVFAHQTLHQEQERQDQPGDDRGADNHSYCNNISLNVYLTNSSWPVLSNHITDANIVVTKRYTM